MNINPRDQLKLYGLNDEFITLKKLHDKQKMPNKILLSGKKGSGKCTLAYHLINYILSDNEKYTYNIENFSIDQKNKSFNLIINGSSPNFDLIDLEDEKKSISISQIRKIINKLNQSNLNNKPRFILIDNIEYLTLSSINALLKILEQSIENTFFILIDNNKISVPTLKSRFLNFRINHSHTKSLEIIKLILKADLYDVINEDLLSYYFTPGKIINLIHFAKNNDIDIRNLNLKEIIDFLIIKKHYKESVLGNNIIYDFLELYFYRSNNYKKEFFLKKITKFKKFNLDEESLFIEFQREILND